MTRSIDRLLVRKILERATSFEWSLQGFGMFRLRLDGGARLHVWDDRYQTPGVSLLHDHPWRFTSTIIAGGVRNLRYAIAASGGVPYKCAMVRGGVGGGLSSPSWDVPLTVVADETFVVGRTYAQAPEDIHESRPLRGTVTVVTREFSPDRHHSRVFWEADKAWVSAEPRTPTEAEVRDMAEHALARFFPPEPEHQM